MKKHILILAVLMPLILNAQSFQWAKQYNEFFSKLTTTANGTYATGTRILAAKLDGNGKVLWSKAFPSSYLFSSAIKLDSKGNIYVTGAFYGTSQIGDTTIKATIGEAFVAKLDSLGEILWLRQSTSYNAAAYELYLDANDNPIISGYFSKTSFSFGGQSINGSGANDGFVMKLSSNGNMQWLHAVGGQGDDRINHIMPIADDVLYMTGYYNDGAQFGNDPAPITNAKTGFVAEFNPLTGTITQISTDTSMVYNHIISAGAGYYLTATGGKGMLIKIDASFNPLQTIEIEGASFSSIAIAPDGTIMAGGAFYDNCKIGSYSFTCKGESDFFLAQFNAAGILEWVIQPSGPNIDVMSDIKYSMAENLFYLLGAVQSGPVNLGNVKIQGDFSGAPFLAKTSALPVSIAPAHSSNLSRKIYPNPARDYIIVELESKETGLAELLSLTGQRLEQIPISGGLCKINLRSHYNGVYLLKVTTATNSFTEPVRIIRRN